MGNLSKQYNPVEYQIRSPKYPTAGGKDLDSIKTDSGNPHWNNGVTPLKKSDIDTAYAAAETYLTNITNDLQSIYDSLCSVNSLEPLIEFYGKSEQVDERFDEIIERLNDINDEVITRIKQNLDDIDTSAQNYVDNNTENCKFIGYIVEETEDEKGNKCYVKVGERHSCVTHSTREYRYGSGQCPFCN